MHNPAPIRVALDLETTGLQVESEGIIEVGAVKFRGAETLETFESFIDPRRPLPYRIQRLTTITPAMLVGAPQMGAVAPKLRTFLSDFPLVGHNIGFDASFLRRVQIADRNPLLDTFELASLLMPSLTSYSLENVAAVLGLSAPIHHRALADAQLSQAVFLALEQRVAELTDPALNALVALATPAKLPMLALLRREQQRRGLPPPSAPTSSGGTLGNLLNAKLGVNPAVLGTRVATLGPPAPTPIAAGMASATADPALADFVTQALVNGQIAFAQVAPEPERVADVLSPAVQWAARSGQRLVIALATPAGARAMQERFLPQAVAAVGADLTQGLLYEARDYLCLHRWYGPARQAPSLGTETVRGLAKLTMWMHATETGARDEINLGPTEQVAWDVVRAGQTFMELPHCAYRERDWCFGRRARQAASDAQIVVTTHAALLGDAGAAQGTGDAAAYVPPAAGYLILDAQLLEERLQQQASWSIEQAPLQGDLDLLWLREERHTVGLLAQVAEFVPGTNVENWGQQVQRALTAQTAFFAALGTLLVEDRPADQSGGESFNALRLDEKARSLSAWGALAEAWNTLEKRLGTVADTASQAAQALRKVPAAESLAMELAAQGQRLRLWMRRGRESLAQPREGFVYWVRPPQANGRRPRPGNASAPDDIPTLHGSPANLGQFSQAALSGLGAGVVVAGTALAVDSRFEHTLERLGLPLATPTILQPVDYRAQTLLVIPSDAPEPNAPAYQRGLNDALVQVGRALQGNTAVLMASHTALRTTYTAIKPLLESHDIMVLAQGIDGSLRQLWQNFRTQPRVVVLGAGNMWEGWESEQARPQCLFIARLPLAALNDPLQAARADHYVDAMHQYVVPQAALRLRLALNRLAWEHDRRNVVVLYDRRVQTKDYGPTILNSLPGVTQRDESVTMLGNAVRDWLQVSGATLEPRP